ncbi:MAG: class II aldolase/adducin family protein [Clostridium sp.]|jgi:L-ribulose-5-phosphate 4-epimerase
MNKDFVRVKNDFLAAAKRTYESGIQTGTGGNLSVRIPGEDLMIVKPSGYTYGQCSEENLCITDFDGNLVIGSLKPTQESVLHGNLYRRYPQIGGIVHTHSPYAILNSLQFSQVDLLTMHSALKMKVPVPVADVLTQAVTEDELPKIFHLIDANPGLLAFILKGHGIVAMNKTAVKAGQTAELVEETSLINWENKKYEALKNMRNG